jgi:hypothetical protein
MIFADFSRRMPGKIYRKNSDSPHHVHQSDPSQSGSGNAEGVYCVRKPIKQRLNVVNF